LEEQLTLVVNRDREPLACWDSDEVARSGALLEELSHLHLLQL
jgi:hypothetical protein